MAINPPVDVVHYSTSWCFPAHTLAAIRGLFSVYIFASIITILVWRSDHDPPEVGHYFSYFTSLSFWGLGFYFAFSAVHSATYWFTGVPALAQWGAVLQQLHSIFYSTIVVYPFIVSIVYWALIYERFENNFEIYSNASQHALNAVFALFELVFARTEPLPWIHLLYLLVMLALYVGVAYITVASEHFYVYTFLDQTRPGGRGRVTGYVFAILAIAIVIFVIVRYLILLRVWIVEKKRGNLGRLEHRRGRVSRDARLHTEPKV